MILKTINTPQDIFILGFYIEDTDETFSTTDDEDNIRVQLISSIQLHSMHLDICGFVYVLNRSELLERLDKLEESDAFGGIFIKDFCGDVKLRVENEDGKDILSPNYVTSEYCRYQTTEDDVADINLIFERSEVLKSIDMQSLSFEEVIKSVKNTL